MSKFFVNKDSGQNYPPKLTHPKKFYPRKRVKVCPGHDLKAAQRIQIRNPKWAYFEDSIHYKDNFSAFKALRKCKSLQITSIWLHGRQCGATVGHFHGELKYIQRVSKYLKALDFEAGVMSRKRFVDFRRWILKQKHLTNLSFVPYYFPDEREDDVQDWDRTRTKGVSSLIRSLVQVKQLTLFGFAQESLIKRLDLKPLNRLEEFTIKTALRPEGCDGEPDELYEPHLKMVEKALECKALKTITLQSEAEMADKNIWKSLNKLIASRKKPLNVDVEVDFRWTQRKTSEWFKKIFANLPANIQVTYSIGYIEYFLSMPQGTERLPVDDESDEDEDDDDDSDDDNENEDEAEEDQDNSGKDGNNQDNIDEIEEEEEKENSDEDEEDEDVEDE